MAERLTSEELATRLDVSQRTLKAWRSEGMPYLPRGGPRGHLHPWEDVKTWLVDNDRAGFVPAEEGT